MVGRRRSQPPDGAHLRDDTFRARVRGDREVTLVPWHPSLQPARQLGRRHEPRWPADGQEAELDGETDLEQDLR